MLAELRRDIEGLRHDQGAPAIPAHERELYGMLADLRREIHDIHELKAHSYQPNESREAIAAAYGARAAEYQPRSASPALAVWWSNGGLLRNIVVSYLPVALIAVAAVYALTKPQPHANEPNLITAGPSTVPTLARAALKDDATPVYEALASGSVSPKGVPVAGVDVQQALARAQALLSATGPARDTEEGGFWLKRYLAMAQGDKRLPRALTQLGSVYAEPPPTAPPITQGHDACGRSLAPSAIRSPCASSVASSRADCRSRQARPWRCNGMSGPRTLVDAQVWTIRSPASGSGQAGGGASPSAKGSPDGDAFRMAYWR